MLNRRKYSTFGRRQHKYVWLAWVLSFGRIWNLSASKRVIILTKAILRTSPQGTSSLLAYLYLTALDPTFDKTSKQRPKHFILLYKFKTALYRSPELYAASAQKCAVRTLYKIIVSFFVFIFFFFFRRATNVSECNRRLDDPGFQSDMISVKKTQREDFGTVWH